MRKVIDFSFCSIFSLGMAFITSVPCLGQNPFAYMGNVQPMEILFDVECIDTIALKHGTSIEYYDKTGVYKKTVWHTKNGFTEENWKNGRWHGLYLEWSNPEGIKKLMYCYLDRCYQVKFMDGTLTYAGGDSVGRPRGDYSMYSSETGQLKGKGKSHDWPNIDTLYVYHNNGLLAGKGLNFGSSFTEDSRIGLWKEYYEDGKLKLQSNHAYDLNLLPDDEYRWKHGKWEYYRSDGNLEKEEFWEKGNLMETKEY